MWECNEERPAPWPPLRGGLSRACPVRKGKISWRGFVGARHASPASLRYLSGEFDTGANDPLRKAFPWGKVATLSGGRMRGGRGLDEAPAKAFPQKHRAGFPCRGEARLARRRSTSQSPLLLTEGGTAQAVTGVEGTRCEFSDCPERRDTPHPSWALPMQPSPQGEGLRLAGSAYSTRRIGACPAPTRISGVRPAPHPSRLTPSHLPPGEGISQKGRYPSTTSYRTPPQSRRCRDSVVEV